MSYHPHIHGRSSSSSMGAPYISAIEDKKEKLTSYELFNLIVGPLAIIFQINFLIDGNMWGLLIVGSAPAAVLAYWKLFLIIKRKYNSKHVIQD